MNSPRLTMCNRQYFGFTLVELMVVLSVLGILTILAVPTYREFVMQGCRTDAMISLERIANEQEQFYFDNNSYASAIGLLPVQSTSPERYYQLSTQRPSGNNTYTVTAQPLGTSDCLPADDIRYRVNHTGNREKSLDQGATWVDNWE